ncbi:integrase family protein [Burkholderia sp. BCC1988]|uniref:tyrosine-type recombinase/integrase n=1 Tax=Burkholderia sp. BCC1988 TaxID=2817443 RepID=UPI002AB0BB80|nr:integrase family protein [Burkholderia sp. BCC1988]
MSKVNFTTERVNSLPCVAGKQQTIHWDAKSPGLGLRVTKSGARAFVFESRLFGKTIRLTIGDPRSWDLSNARAEAARLALLIDAGRDPREVSAEQKAAHEARLADARRKDVLFVDAWEAYLDDLRTQVSPKTKRPRSAQYIEDHRKLSAAGGEEKKRGKGLTSRGPLYVLMRVKLAELTGAAIAEWLRIETTERPTSAAYAYRVIKALVRWCESHERFAGLIPSDCYSSTKVKSLLPSANTKEGDSLQREQLHAWFTAVRAIPNFVVSVYLQGLLINGPRREELAELRWDDVDFDWNSMRLNDKIEVKNGRVIPLTPYFAMLLRELRNINDKPPATSVLATLAEQGKTWHPSPWVFPSPTSESGHIEEPRYAHNQAIQAAGLSHVTLHGLRRSFGTLAEWCEVPVGVVAQIQGHKPSALAEKHYRRRPLDMLRMWHTKIEAWMLEQANIKFEPPRN